MHPIIDPVDRASSSPDISDLLGRYTDASVVEAEAVDVLRFVDGLIGRKDTDLDTAALAG